MAPAPAKCRGPECTRDAITHGLCPAHYKQERRGKPLTPLRESTGERFFNMQVPAHVAAKLRGLGAASEYEAVQSALLAWAGPAPEHESGEAAPEPVAPPEKPTSKTRRKPTSKSSRVAVAPAGLA